MSHHTSHVTRHTSHVTRHTSHVTRHTSHNHTTTNAHALRRAHWRTAGAEVNLKELACGQASHHASHITRHASHHASRVTPSHHPPNRELLLFLSVFAFPNASSTGLVLQAHSTPQTRNNIRAATPPYYLAHEGLNQAASSAAAAAGASVGEEVHDLGGGGVCVRVCVCVCVCVYVCVRIITQVSTSLQASVLPAPDSPDTMML
jgi:hypothetical protein